jgi:hypothetical protein
MLFRIKLWYKQRAWQRGHDDFAASKPERAPFWAFRRSYHAGYTARGREWLYDLELWASDERVYRPLEIYSTESLFDYEVESFEFWPPEPSSSLTAGQQAEIEGHAALIVRPCWIFHKNDADPWPSTLHGHHNERPSKLDAINGFIYNIHTRKHVQTVRQHELARIQAALFASKDFGERARALIVS